jgi:hypothetical protein
MRWLRIKSRITNGGHRLADDHKRTSHHWRVQKSINFFCYESPNPPRADSPLVGKFSGSSQVPEKWKLHNGSVCPIIYCFCRQFFTAECLFVETEDGYSASEGKKHLWVPHAGAMFADWQLGEISGRQRVLFHSREFQEWLLWIKVLSLESIK